MRGSRGASVWEEFERLLRPPEEGAAMEASGGAVVRLLLGAVLCFAAYGATAGLFQGGAQVGWSAIKTPLIVLGTALLCLPSLYVFATLAGARLSPARFAFVVAAFLALLGLLALGLIPINWLFSVSSRSLLFVVWLHVGAWILAVRLARRFLRSVFADEGPRRAVGAWLILFVVVSLQVTTCLRPVLWRGANAPAFEGQRLSFMEHFARVTRD
jgi:hypothetical protein